MTTWTGAGEPKLTAHLNYNGDKESEPDDMEDEEEGHEEVEDVVDREHLNQLQHLGSVSLGDWMM